MESPLKKKQLLEFEFEFSDAQPVPNNPEFSYGKAKILYKNLNRNNSYLTDESTKNAMPTLFGIPIVGEYNEQTDNFGSHGGKIEISDKGIEFIDTTVPFGYISENSKVYWETIEEVNGTKRDYLVADRCVFWTGRYPQLNTLLKNGKFNQSMEIGVNNGEFAIIDGEEVFRIDDFTFSALCILGISKEDDPEGHVEPCFESASIEIYDEQKSDFQMKFNNMITAYKNGNQEGGQPVADKKEPEKQEFEEQETQVVDPQGEEQKQEEQEVQEDVKAETETETEVETKEEKEESTEVTEHTEEAVTDEQKEFTVTAEQFAAVKNDLAISEAANKSMADKLNTIKEEFSVLEQEVKELRAFKRQTELDEVAEKFAGKIEDDILKSTIEANSEKSVEELESLIFAEIGKQNFSQKDSNKKEPFSVSVAVEDKPAKTVGKYAHLKEKHLN